MRLLDIWVAKEAWLHLMQMKKSPQMAYRLYKYGELVLAELQACDQHRQDLIREISGISDPNTPVEIEPDTPQMTEYGERFNAFLKEESDIPKLTINMENMINSLAEVDGNDINEHQLKMLETFFQD